MDHVRDISGICPPQNEAQTFLAVKDADEARSSNGLMV
jgi:hypothetical protein